MRHSLLTTMMLAAALSAQAADYEYLTIEKTDGTALSLTAVGLTISYSSSQLTATNGSETATLQLSDLSRMYFSNTRETTAVATLESLPQDEAATIYDLGGRKVADVQQLSEARTLLRKGVYLVKQNQKTIKIQVR